MAVEEFVKKTTDLLDKERDAEIQETSFLVEKLSAKELERRGVCLLKLRLSSRRSGLYGRMVAVFEPQAKLGGKNTKPELPSHNLTPGDIVGVALMRSEATEKPLATGIVSQVTTSNISIAFDDSQDIFELDENELFKLTKLANDVTYRRLKSTLQDLAKYRDGPAERLIETFFCLEEISGPSGEFPITFVNESLDTSQREAVKFALTQKEVAIIHGPPGTGKTTTVVELIIQAVRQGLKVLATAPSNIAVDNLVERLASHKQKIIRIGHPARLLTHLQKYSLDAIVSGSEETGIVRDVKSDLQKVLTKLKKAKSGGERRSLREEMKQLRREATQREEAATRDVLSRADVVLVTLTSATNDGPLKHLKDDHFDLLIIDECSQALEAACWIGLLRAPRCVLAGDHLQLPPTILSKEAAAAGLEVTLMERLLKMLAEEKGKDVVRMLTTQYRMHEDIMMWASQQLYQGKLTAHQSVASHLLSDLSDVTDCEETCSPLLLIDTAGCGLHELELPEEVSKGNEGEADIVAAHVEDLIKSGVMAGDIAVIAPYNLQVELLRVRLCAQHPDLEVKSVDGFQGREKEAVVISMVRSNTSGEVGFLAEKRRINVAVTRARRHLTVVCDSETVTRDPFIRSLVDYMMDKGEVVSAHQFIQEGKVSQMSSRPARLTNLMESMDTKKSGTSKSRTVPKSNKTKGDKPLQTKEEKVKQYQQELQNFVDNSELSVLDYAPSLNSHDRMVIHEVAEKLGLSHVSTGEGKERHIQVSKVKVQSSQPQTSTSQETVPSPITESTGDSETRLARLHQEDVLEISDSLEEGSESSNCGHPDNQRLAENDVYDKTSLPNATDDHNAVSTDMWAIDDKDVIISETDTTDDNNRIIHDNGITDIRNMVITSEIADATDNSSMITTDSGDAVTTGLVTPDALSHGNESTDGRNTRENKSKKRTSQQTETAINSDKKTSEQPQNLTTCEHCQKQILNDNLTLHVLHCARRNTAQSAQEKNRETHMGGARQKEGRVKEKRNKEKDKMAKSHVQKAADVLSKIDNDDFDALIASVTELDSKCAFRKCKTLTNTLGRNCEYCTRRFCLTHLMPEVHGCGDAVRDAARRQISRDGVLTSGSGVPNKKPNAARRAQLENKMEKKLGELTGSRARNAGKKKS